MDINILFEDKFIIVAEKPPKMPCQRDKTNDLDLLTILKNRIMENEKVNNPYIGLIHRLDRPVGGVMLFAKTKPANATLSEAIRERQFFKKYLCICQGIPQENEGIFEDKLVKIGSKNISIVKDSIDSKQAILEYKLLETVETEEGPLSLLEVILKTGRHHQIRAQLAHHNMPLWGDTKYNINFSNRSGWTQTALWAYKLGFNHPKTKKPLEFTSLPDNEYPWNLFKQTI